MNQEDLTFEEYSKLLDEEPTIRSAKEAMVRYLPERSKVNPFCGNCGSRFISDDADWYRTVTGEEGRNYWQIRYANMMLEHMSGIMLVRLYRRYS